MKKLLSLVTVLAVILSLCAVPVGAVEEYESDAQGVIYELNGDGTAYTVTGTYDTAADVVIPATFKGLPVTAIGYGAFWGCTEMLTLAFEGNITEVDTYAFRECDNLTSVTVPPSVTKMGLGVFEECTHLDIVFCLLPSQPDGWNEYWKTGCDAEVYWGEGISVDGVYYEANADGTEYTVVDYAGGSQLVIPDTYYGVPVTRIASNALADYDHIETAVIGSNVREIKKRAFAGCTALTRIVIPTAVTSMGSEVFNSCTSLTSILCGHASKPEGWNDDWKGDCSATVRWLGEMDDQGLTYYKLTDGTAYWVSGALDPEADIVIPDTFNGLPVAGIDDYALEYEEGIKTLVIGSNVRTIGMYAFGNCRGLTEITIPANVKNVDEYVFRGCTSLTDIYCEFTEKPSGWNAYWNTDCAAEVHWMANIDAQGLVYELNSEGTAYTVVGCEELTSYVEIPDTYGGLPVTAIGFGAFWDCTTIEYIEIGANVKTIDMYAFVNCIHLEQITIPATVTTIGDEVFDNCTALTDIYCEFTVKPSGWSDIWNDGCDAEVHWLAKDIMLGDINGDEIVNMYDAMVLYQFASGNRDGMTDDQKEAADIDKNGVINMVDVLYLYGYASGSRDSLT